MLPVVRFNANRGQDRLRLFETGNVFLHNPNETSGAVRGFAEHTSLLLLASGPRAKRAFDTTPAVTDYFDVKGVVMSICTGLQLRADFSRAPGARPFAAYGEVVSIGGKALGFVGRLSDTMADQFDASAPVYFAELNLDHLVAAKPDGPTRYRPVSRYPSVERDIAMVVDGTVAAGSLLSTIRAAGGGLLIDADIFDIYSGAGVPDQKKSVAISLRFGADRTLTDAEVDGVVDFLISAIGSEHGGELRT
jgi:phenylalanyl-tRNA synthetase beta chain